MSDGCQNYDRGQDPPRQPESEPPVRVHPAGSADDRGYAKGYVAGIKRVKALEAEIARLNEIKTPLPPLPLPDSHDVTIEYLITTAEAMLGAANMLIAMRNPPNDRISDPAHKTP